MRFVVLVVGSLLVVAPGCASDPGQFQPAKSGVERAPTNDAYRVKTLAPECELVGTASAEGEDELAVERLGTIAARHGGNRFVVNEDERDHRVHRDMNGNLAPKTNHRMQADVYRCPD